MKYLVAVFMGAAFLVGLLHGCGGEAMAEMIFTHHQPDYLQDVDRVKDIKWFARHMLTDQYRDAISNQEFEDVLEWLKQYAESGKISTKKKRDIAQILSDRHDQVVVVSFPTNFDDKGVAHWGDGYRLVVTLFPPNFDEGGIAYRSVDYIVAPEEGGE